LAFSVKSTKVHTTLTLCGIRLKLVKALGDSRFAQRLEETLYKSALTPCVVTPSVGGRHKTQGVRALCPWWHNALWLVSPKAFRLF